MGKFIDETGNVYGKWTVIGREPNVKNNAMWRCMCECGTIGIVSGSSLRRGNSKSCGCIQREFARNIKYRDLTGQRFGRLLVKCNTGEKNKSNKFIWECECDCGSIVRIASDRLLSGNTKSCGCLQKEIASRNQTKNLIGIRFGKLVVEEKAGINKNHQMEWHCLCDCGNHKTVTSVDLIHGRVSSCGCNKSCGEQIIQSWLEQHDIVFEKEKRFDDCKNKRPLPFDFYLPQEKLCIEFDGIQHYQESKLFSKRTSLQERIKLDNIKTKYCEDNDLRLLRISYLDKDKIELILSETLIL